MKHTIMQSSPSHDSQILDVDLIKNFTGQGKIFTRQLICQSEVMKLPRVGAQVEGVVLGPLGHPAVHGGEHGLEPDRFTVWKDGADGVAAQRDPSDRRSGNESTKNLET
jgi:hypothetical protein